jgi:anti-sigma B factor antagonist
MSDAELHACRCGDLDVVALSGDLDAGGAASIAGAVLAATAGGCVIVDLAAAEFVDCYALGALARVRKLARQAGCDVLLVGPREPVWRLLDLTGLADVFSVHVSAAAAAASLGSACGRPARYRAQRPVIKTASQGRADPLKAETG